jgi:DNA end-binding protein Ku
MATGRAYWKGFLKLSLVTCPVALFPATSLSEKTHFHQINRKTGNRLRQQMVDEETGKVVDKDEKGRGYEISKGTYVEVEPEDLDAVEVESTHTINFSSFVPADEIDKRYYDHPYYIVPNAKTGEEAYAVIRDAMKDKRRVALAHIVFANREHVMAIEPWGKGMLGTTLHYDDEVLGDKDAFKSIPSPKIDKEMVKLASHILDTMAGHFDPTIFKDEYELALRKLVQRKASGKTIERAEHPHGKSNVIDLMAALRQSVGQGSSKSAQTTKKTKATPETQRRRRARSSVSSRTSWLTPLSR